MQIEAEKEKAKSLHRMAASVAHDIRSPLAALNVVTKSLTSLDPEVEMLFRGAVDRIKWIAESLLTDFRSRLNSENQGQVGRINAEFRSISVI